ncbi:hypothetical protein BHE74_00032086 [Ensete ventricosum]|nr:hypothetical protein GW17_00012382 [Ensete ventricosum]RWW60878.1 hypothetical protein BHE74_00032086 [Ensete ventricosum]RZS01419.1 hypothetical protein BHM03_00031276 [Ensete ventricosum]
MVATQLTAKEAKKAWEEERSYIAKWERRVMASYKEFQGFCCSLERANQAMYEFEYQNTLRCFKVRYHELEVDEDPFVELPSKAKVLPFNDYPTTPSALSPSS